MKQQHMVAPNTTAIQNKSNMAPNISYHMLPAIRATAAIVGTIADAN